MSEGDGRIRVMALAASLGKGGAERVLSLLVENLDRSKFSAEFTIFDGPVEYTLPDDVPLHVLAERPPASTDLSLDVPQRLAVEHAGSILWMETHAAKLAELVRERRPDIVISSPVWASIMAGVASAGFPAGTKLVNRGDAPPSAWLQDSPTRDLFSHLITQHFNEAAGIVAVSTGVAEDLQRAFGVRSDRMTVIPNPANVSRIETMLDEAIDEPEFAGDVPVVLFVGRLERVKGIEYLLRALVLVLEHADVRCVLIGEGTQRGYLEALVRHLGLSDRVSLIGNRLNPFKYMARARMLVLPSLSEGMSNVLVEAMVCQCPVIATDVEGGSTREVLGECGLIVPRQDPAALAEAILTYLTEPSLAENSASCAYERVARFELSTVMAQYTNVLESAARADGTMHPPEDSESAAGPDDRVRVLMLTSAMSRGGSQSFIAALLERLDRRRFLPMLATKDDSPPEYEIPADVTVHSIAVENPASLTSPVTQSLAVDGWIGDSVGRIVAAIRRLEPHVVFASPEWTSVLAATAAAEFGPETRFICRVDAPPSVAFGPDGGERSMGSLLKAHFNSVDRVVAVSSAIKADLVENFDIDPDRVVVMKNAVDVAGVSRMAQEAATEVDWDDGVPTIVFVGRLERVKGLDTLFAALARVLGKTRVRCVLVGDGSQRGYLAALAKHLGIDDAIAFVGSQANPFRFMSRASVFVLPSLSEGLPTVLIEAMACGCPVIATDIAGGAVRELLLDGECGVIVPSEDSDALADAIEALLGDEQRRTQLSAAGAARAHEFDIEVIIEENGQLLESVARTAADCPRNGRASVLTEPEPEQTSPAELSQRAPSQPDVAQEDLAEAGLGQESPGPRVDESPRTLHLATRARRILAAVRSRFFRAAHAGSGLGCYSWLPQRLSGKTQVVVLISSLDDESVGSGTRAVLNSLDRGLFDITLVRVFDGPDALETFGGLRQILLQPDLEYASVANTVVPARVPEDQVDEYRWMLARARSLGRIAKSLDADVVLARGLIPSVVAGVAADLYLPGAATILATNARLGQYVAVDGATDVYGSLMLDHWRSVDRVLVPTESFAADLVSRLGVDRARTVVLPDPIESLPCIPPAPDTALVEEWMTSPGAFVVHEIGPGSLDGFEYLMQAMLSVRDSADVRGVVTGAGESLDSIRAAIRRHGLSEAVLVTEGHADLARVLPRASAYVHPAVGWGSGIPAALVAAVAAECPVIATKTSELIERLIEGNRSGLVVPQRDGAAIAEAILQVVWDPDAAIAMASRARARLNDVSPETVVGQLQSIIAGLLDDANSER